MNTIQIRVASYGLMLVVVGALLTLLVSSVHAQTGAVSASGTLNAKITITLTDPTMALGTPDPTCEGLTDGSTSGEFTVYNGTTGNQGCAYVWGGLQVRVKSNRAWTGTINGGDGSPTSGVKVTDGNFLYNASAAVTTYASCSADTALATTTASFESSGNVGNTLYNFYHCILLDWDDVDGSIDSTITYTVTQ